MFKRKVSKVANTKDEGCITYFMYDGGEVCVRENDLGGNITNIDIMV